MPEDTQPPIDSILNTVKKALGLAPDYKVFDVDLILHINSTFGTLNQLGVGPLEGFSIEDETVVWGDYTLNDKNLNSVKSYIFVKVRLLFDPPATSFTLDALNKQAEEFAWRLNVYVD